LLSEKIGFLFPFNKFKAPPQTGPPKAAEPPAPPPPPPGPLYALDIKAND